MQSSVVFGNYFTLIPLLRQLRYDSILAAGTVCVSRLSKCPLLSAKLMKKKPSGYSEDCVTEDDSVAVIWNDNNTVTLALKFVEVGEHSEVKRWDKQKKEHVFVCQPEIIRNYESMGGVDKLDFLLQFVPHENSFDEVDTKSAFSLCGHGYLQFLTRIPPRPSNAAQVKLLDLINFRMEVAEALIRPQCLKRSAEGHLLQRSKHNNPQQDKKKNQECCFLVPTCAMTALMIGLKLVTRKNHRDASSRSAQEGREYSL